jgi:hypothetical protein
MHHHRHHKIAKMALAMALHKKMGRGIYMGGGGLTVDTDYGIHPAAHHHAIGELQETIEQGGDDEDISDHADDLAEQLMEHSSDVPEVDAVEGTGFSRLGGANANVGMGLHGHGGMYGGMLAHRRGGLNIRGLHRPMEAQLPNALQSKPFGANFRFSKFLPTEYQHLNNGTQVPGYM